MHVRRTAPPSRTANIQRFGAAGPSRIATTQRFGAAGPSRRIPNADGFSLIEALVASGLLASAIAGLMQVFILAARSTAHARDTSYATVLASQKMEELRAAPLPDDADQERSDRIDAYTRRWTIEPLPANPFEAVIISVIVSPPARPDAGGEVRITTVRLRPGL